MSIPIPVNTCIYVLLYSLQTFTQVQILFGCNFFNPDSAERNIKDSDPDTSITFVNSISPYLPMNKPFTYAFLLTTREWLLQFFSSIGNFPLQLYLNTPRRLWLVCRTVYSYFSLFLYRRCNLIFHYWFLSYCLGALVRVVELLECDTFLCHQICSYHFIRKWLTLFCRIMFEIWIIWRRQGWTCQYLSKFGLYFLFW